ncbi:MAG: T9SS type A sorting domain-containing protein [Ignavibacteriaceae bacterium]
MNKFKVSAFIFLFIISGITYAQTKTIQHDGTARSYMVHLPPNYNADSAHALILIFHGWTHTPVLTETHTKMSIKADSCGFIAVYPAGIIGSNKEWNENDQYTVDDVGFIKELIDTLIQDYSVDTLKIYASGFSDGAGMAYRIAYELPGKIAAVAAIAGSLPGTNYNPQRATPTINFHAKNDPYTSYSTMGTIIDYWKTLNTSVTDADTFFVNDGAVGVKWEGDNGTEFILYSTNIGGHSWPGGNPSFHTPSQAISACDLLWDFFCAHPLKQSATGVVENNSDPGKSGYLLYQNYPNPFNPSTSISFSLPENSFVTLKVYNLLGQEVAALINEVLERGVHSVNLDMSNQPSGIYLYTISSGNFSSSKKLLLLK